MHCDTSTKPIFDMTKHPHPRALHVEVVRFIRGIRGLRKKAVTKNQIYHWLYRTPEEAVAKVVSDLLAEGKIIYNPTRKEYAVLKVD